MPPATLVVGVYGQAGYHFLLFTALQLAPPVEANLINYLWPLGIVLMPAPLLLPGVRLTAAHVLAALVGLAGAALAILGRGALRGFGRRTRRGQRLGGNGHACAAGAAFIWSSYSLMTKRLAPTGRPFSTAAIGTFGLVSGPAGAGLPRAAGAGGGAVGARLAADCPARPSPAGRRLLPVGRRAETGRRPPDRRAGLPDAAGLHLILLATTGRPLTWNVALATLMILGAAVVGTRAR